MRGAVTLLIPLHQGVERAFGLTLPDGLIVTGILVWALARASAIWLPETYGKSLEFEER